METVQGSGAPSARRQEELQRTLAKRKSVRQQQLEARQQRRAEAAIRAREQAEREAREAPLREARENERARLQLEGQRVQALRELSDAAQRDAQVNRARYQLQSQALGQPQVLVPGEGFVPYPYAIIQPIRPVQ
jgi:hypothetical protein